MKKYFIASLASVAAISILASCVKETPAYESEKPAGGELITITATIPDGGLTKVDMAEESYGGSINLVWHEGDKIIVTDAADATNKQEFTLSDGAGTASGTFTGLSLAEATSYNISYDAIGDNFSYAVQTQAADASTAHLKYAATISGVSDYTAFEFSDAWATKYGGTFASSSVLRVRAKLGDLNPKDVNAVILKSDAAIFAGNKELKVIIGTPGSDEGEKDFITVYATLPIGDQAIAAGTVLIIQFQMSDKKYDKYTVYRELGAGTILGGKVNGFNIKCRDKEDHFTNTKYANQSVENIGTASNPYLIGDQHQMDAMHEELSTTKQVYFTLIDDIDLTGIEWAPLNPASPYDKKIYFDGANHTVYNLHSTTALSYPSFAGVVYGTIKDVTFDTSEVEGTDTNVGVVCGYLGTTGHIGDCIGVTVKNAKVTAHVSNGALKGRYAGGFAGYIGCDDSSVKNCHVKGTVAVTNTDAGASAASTAGGFIGHTDKMCTIEDCTVSGNVTVTMNTSKTGCSVAGFIAVVGAAITIKGCTAAANVNNPSSYYTGGFIGQTDKAITVKDCAYLGGNIIAERNDSKSASNSPVAGFIGRIKNGAGASFTNCYVDGAHISATHSGRVGGFLGDGGNGANANTYTSCYVKNSTISGAQHSGGFGGTLYGKASKCYVESTTITANDSNAGGFTGYLENGTATNCYASATVVGGAYSNIGGFVGNARLGTNVPAQVTYCFTNSTVSGSAESVGAFIGGVSAVPNSITKNIAWNGTLSFVGSAGDLDISTAIVDNYCGTEGTISSQAAAYGWDTAIWNLDDPVPVLK